MASFWRKLRPGQTGIITHPLDVRTQSLIDQRFPLSAPCCNMPRLILDTPPCFAYATQVSIYLSHINKSGHLDNAQLLTLVSEARARFFDWLKAQGFDFGGLTFVMADMMTQYKSEGFRGEDMRVELTPADINTYGFDLWFRMTEITSGREVACGKSGLVFVSKSNSRPSPLPDAVRAQLEDMAHMVQPA